MFLTVRHTHELDQHTLVALVRLAEAVRAAIHIGQETMSKIGDFSAAVQASFDQIGTAIDDLTGDVKNLTDQIAALQNSTGTVTPEDQALLDGIQAKASDIANKLAALDAETPPATPSP